MAKPTPSRLADQYQTYPTASAAAVAALRSISDKQRENGGGILYNKAQNVYAATQPVGQADGSHFAAAVGVPQGWQLHSTYHTHPSGPRSTQFSDDDINMANQLKAPSYILARDDDKIRMFDPTTSAVSKDTSGGKFSQGRFSTGSVVDETPPQAAKQAPATMPAPSLPPSPQSAAASQPAQPPAPQAPPPAPDAADAAVAVSGSRITMQDFASRHRATRYKGKIIQIK